MFDLMTREWRMFAVRGVAAIVFGILALVWPGATLEVLVLFFGAYTLVDGTAMLVALLRGDAVARRHAWSVALIGVTGIIAGVVTFFWPGLTALSLLYIVAAWAIATGLFEVSAAIALRREIDGEQWMILGGLLSIVFGGLLIAFPGSGLVSLVWLLGGWAMLFGGANLGLAYRLHGIEADLRRPVAAH